MSTIASSIAEVRTAIDSITKASIEQSDGVDQVTGNFDSVTQVSKEAAQSAQSLASASHDLNEELKTLNNMVNQFKV